MELEGFILTRGWRDTPRGVEFEYWAATGSGPLRIRITGQEPLFFIERIAEVQTPARREHRELKTLHNLPVDALYFKSMRDLRDTRNALHARDVLTYESDVKPEDRYLMERFIRGAFMIESEHVQDHGAFLEVENPVMRPSDYRPHLKVASLDIETAGLTGELYSIGISGPADERVFMIGQGESTDTVTYVPDERAALLALVKWMDTFDPDLIIGWNVVDFDFHFLDVKARALGVPLRIGRGGTTADVLPPATSRQQSIMRINGRVVLDGIRLLRLGFWDFESYSLENVSREMLGRGKIIHDVHNRLEEIQRLYREEKPALAAYNLEDCRLVDEIFQKADLVHFAVERAALTGLALDRQGGSVAAFDFQYLPHMHRAGYVAPDLRDGVDPITSPGGYVMDSKPGLFENVLVLDFKSLYPSIIRTFLIDPLGMAVPGENPVPGFIGATYNREMHILPEQIAQLWAARDAAKREKNTPLSTAIKIIMNSFYGVLGSTGCRFYHPKLATSITKRGHELIERSRDRIEERGYDVIYGDTDSVFVLVGEGVGEDECHKIGNTLTSDLNAYWKEAIREEFDLESFLELEFETHYLKFFMPTIRGSETGSKKRYAGLVRNGEELSVLFKGLEAVRTDWTPLAREFQVELFRRIFHNEPYEAFVEQASDDLLAGKLDDKLYYRKRIRRALDEYVKNVPPHVQAARKLENPGRWVSYAITVNGPEPEQARTSGFDYAHYLDRQLAPAADGILYFLGTSFEKIAGKQMDMF